METLVDSTRDTWGISKFWLGETQCAIVVYLAAVWYIPPSGDRVDTGGDGRIWVDMGGYGQTPEQNTPCLLDDVQRPAVAGEYQANTRKVWQLPHHIERGHRFSLYVTAEFARSGMACTLLIARLPCR